MPRIKQTARGQTSRANTVRNSVVVNADSEEEARRKGWKYFSYTSRDTYTIETVQEMQPGKWKVTALRRNPSMKDAPNKFHEARHTETDAEVREPYI